MSTHDLQAGPAAAVPAPPAARGWFSTLLMTDLWERFGFYGMQAILVLYAAAPRSAGGLGLATADATALFGAWIGLTFMLSLPGGWVADRLFGARRSLLLGGGVIVAGYTCLALPSRPLVPVGLALVSAGTALYKPNHQALITMMYRDRGSREAGISMIYLGIQASALLAPLITGYLGERVNWHLGFAAAGIAMLIGVLQLAAARARFGGAGDEPGRPLSPAGCRRVRRAAGTGLAVLAVLVVAGLATGVLTPTTAIIAVGMSTLVLPAVAFIVLYRNAGLTALDRRKLRTFLWILFGSTLFWMVIAQDGSVLTIFGRDRTDRDVLGFSVPVSWLQAVTPLFILALAPLVALALRRTADRVHAVPVKFAVGLLLAGGSFWLMAAAAAAATGGDRVPVAWLLVVYLLHACGELIIAAVGIAAAGEVLPRAFLSHVLGLWWLFAAVGGGLGSQLVRLAEAVPQPVYFGAVGTAVVAFGAVMFVRRRDITETLTGPTAPVAERTTKKGLP